MAPFLADSTPGSSGSTSGPFGGGSGGLSFGAVASTSPANAAALFKGTPDHKAFEQTSVFASSSAKGAPESPSKEDQVEEYEPEVDFAPVVPLPDLVEVRTGEEDETATFSERAKLFRYDAAAKEWKERGVGTLKVLRSNAAGSSKHRLLMRRDQTHKVCANHAISAELKLSAMQTSDKAWVWAAMDFADEEMKEEKLAARFKTAELAQAFKAAFEEAVAACAAAPAPAPAAAEAAKRAQTKEDSKPSLAAMFKPAQVSSQPYGQVFSTALYLKFREGQKPKELLKYSNIIIIIEIQGLNVLSELDELRQFYHA